LSFYKFGYCLWCFYDNAAIVANVNGSSYSSKIQRNLKKKVESKPERAKETERPDPEQSGKEKFEREWNTEQIEADRGFGPVQNEERSTKEGKTAPEHPRKNKQLEAEHCSAFKSEQQQFLNDKSGPEHFMIGEGLIWVEQEIIGAIKSVPETIVKSENEPEQSFTLDIEY
jgi:hypothetical protein